MLSFCYGVALSAPPARRDVRSADGRWPRCRRDAPCEVPVPSKKKYGNVYTLRSGKKHLSVSSKNEYGFVYTLRIAAIPSGVEWAREGHWRGIGPYFWWVLGGHWWGLGPQHHKLYFT